MSRTGSLLAVLLAVGVSVAQPAIPTRLEHLGAVVRTQPDFYGAIAPARGETLKVSWAFSAAEVESSGTVRLTLTVRNAVNPRELTRPDLTKIAEFNEKFSLLEPVTADEPAEDAKVVEFVYNLRPRNEGKFEIDPPKYCYYRPGPQGKTLPRAFHDPLPLTVKKPEVKLAPPVPLSGPDSFFEPASGSYAAGGAVPRLYWRALLIAPPVLLVLWVLAWRWVYPDAARLARLRRNRAVRRTLDRLRAARRAADPVGETAAAFRYYLSARFGLPPAANTPGEVLAGLRELNVDDDRVAQVDELLRRCDSERFDALTGGRWAGEEGLTANALRLVLTWEGGQP